MFARLAVLSFVFCCGAGCALRGVAERIDLPEGGREIRDLKYFDGPGFDDAKHRLNVYVPKGSGPFPVVVFAHGGGWFFGDRNQAGGPYIKLGRRLAARGILAVVVSYRLAPEHQHPAHIEDVTRSIAWTFAHAAEYGGDPARIFAMGHSAGAHLVSLAATDPRWLAPYGLSPDRLKGVIGVSGPYDVHRLGSSTLFGGLPMIHRAFGQDHDLWRDVTPMNHVSDGPLPPFLLAYADGDPEILRRAARSFEEALKGRKAAVKVFATEDLDDHFSVITNFAAPGNPLGDEAEAFIFSRAPGAAVARDVP